MRKKKKAGGVAQGVGTEFKPQYHKKKKVTLRGLVDCQRLRGGTRGQSTWKERV
jgi:hypothetical protein